MPGTGQYAENRQGEISLGFFSLNHILSQFKTKAGLLGSLSSEMFAGTGREVDLKQSPFQASEKA